MRELHHRLGADGAAALTPADACPDNNVAVGGRLVLLDFEGAQWRHVAWDVAYLRVPWPTCWCSWRLPDDVADAALERYRARRRAGLPAVADAASTATSTRPTSAGRSCRPTLFLDNALGSERRCPAGTGRRPDPPGDDPAPAAARRRAPPSCRPRPSSPAGCADGCVARWGDVQLDYAPAFR